MLYKVISLYYNNFNFNKMINTEINNTLEYEINFIVNKSFNILKYVFFVNNILIYPHIDDYYNKKINSMPKIKDLINSKNVYFQTEDNFFYEFNPLNINLKVSFFINNFFLNLNISPEICLFEILEEVDYEYIPILNNKYNLDNIKIFEKDYKSFIFRKYIRQNIKIKMNQFNLSYYNLNKIIKT